MSRLISQPPRPQVVLGANREDGLFGNDLGEEVELLPGCGIEALVQSDAVEEALHVFGIFNHLKTLDNEQSPQTHEGVHRGTAAC